MKRRTLSRKQYTLKSLTKAMSNVVKQVNKMVKKHARSLSRSR